MRRRREAPRDPESPKFPPSRLRPRPLGCEVLRGASAGAHALGGLRALELIRGNPCTPAARQLGLGLRVGGCLGLRALGVFGALGI